jgi:hypothetical protein
MDTISEIRRTDIGEQDYSIFVDVEYGGRYVKVKLFGEELKQLLKGHTFHVGEYSVRRFESDLIDD